MLLHGAHDWHASGTIGIWAIQSELFVAILRSGHASGAIGTWVIQSEFFVAILRTSAVHYKEHFVNRLSKRSMQDPFSRMLVVALRTSV
eukprot:1142976-Pelagomonas_calceolata.AAC.1